MSTGAPTSLAAVSSLTARLSTRDVVTFFSIESGLDGGPLAISGGILTTTTRGAVSEMAC